MSSSREIRGRADSLCEEARHKLDANDAIGAYDAARQALQLEIESTEARTILRQLRDRDPNEDVLAACKTFVATWQYDDCMVLANRLEQYAANLSSQQAEECLGLLLDNRPAIEKAKPSTGLLICDFLKLNIYAQKAFIQRCVQNITPIFEKCFELGERLIVGLYINIMDRKQWPTAVANLKAQRGVLQLCLARLINPAEEHIEMACNGIIMILGKGNSKLKGVLDQDAFYIVLECLDIRNPQELKDSARAAIQGMLGSTGDAGKAHISAFVTSKVGHGNNEDLIKAFSAAAATFILIPGPAAQLFLIDGFLQQLIPRLVSNSQASEDRRSNKLELSALELMNAASADNTCGAHIKKHATQWLLDVAEGGLHPQSSSLAAVILAKIRDPGETSRSPEEPVRLAQILCNMLVNTGDPSIERHLLEGLSHVVLKPSTRDLIADNAKLLEKLVSFLSDKSKPWPLAMGSTLVFRSLTDYKRKMTEEELRLAQLKAYSEGSKVQQDSPSLDDQQVLARCTKAVDAGIVPALSVRLSEATDSIRMVISEIMLHLAKDPKARGKMAQQGAIKTLLTMYAKISAMPPEQIMTVNMDRITQTAKMLTQAMARILISVNPNHVFSPSLSILSAVKPLSGLMFLGEAAEADPVGTFEGLLALTNIASMDDDSGREIIIRSTLQHLDALLVSGIPLVQQAATELVCNLMVSPTCIALFADGSPPSKHRLHVLLALADAEQLPTRRAAGGALASLAEYDPGVRQILLRENGVKLILKLCADDDAKRECTHRGLVVLSHMLDAEGPLRKTVQVAIKEASGKSVLENIVADCDGQMKELAQEVLRKLDA